MSALKPLPARGEEGWLDRSLPLLLLSAGIVGAIPVVRSLNVADLNWCYPYLSSDSYDWINNGLYWAGVPVLPSFRPPGLPLVIALLWREGFLSWLPALNVAVLGATAVLLYVLLRERFSPAVSSLTAWVLFSNGFVQDLVRWVSAEVWTIPFLVLAALFFHRAGREPRAYVAFGLALGIGFLFHYATFPAGLGFAASVLLARRQHLRFRSLWAGAAAAVIPPAAWLAARWRYRGLHPEADPHWIEELVRFSPENVSFFAFTGLALLGLLLLPLYAAGVARLLRRPAGGDRLVREAIVPPLVALGLFFGLLYDWADKRFLIYLFPFALAFLALGLEGLFVRGSGGPARRSLASAYLLTGLAWNQIAYPPYGIPFLALTPRDFLVVSARVNERSKTVLSLANVRVQRVHPRIGDALRGGLFDFSLRPPPCLLEGPACSRLPELKWRLDEKLGPGVAVGMEPLPGWPENEWISRRRMSNILGRPVVRPELTPCRIAPGPVDGLRSEFVSGPYTVACRS